jgi:hypothetical protein
MKKKHTHVKHTPAPPETHPSTTTASQPPKPTPTPTPKPTPQPTPHPPRNPNPTPKTTPQPHPHRETHPTPTPQPTTGHHKSTHHRNPPRNPPFNPPRYPPPATTRERAEKEEADRPRYSRQPRRVRIWGDVDLCVTRRQRKTKPPDLQRKKAERAETENEEVGDSKETHTCFGKWFTEKFSVNHFPYFRC